MTCKVCQPALPCRGIGLGGRGWSVTHWAWPWIGTACRKEGAAAEQQPEKDWGCPGGQFGHLPVWIGSLGSNQGSSWSPCHWCVPEGRVGKLMGGISQEGKKEYRGIREGRLSKTKRPSTPWSPSWAAMHLPWHFLMRDGWLFELNRGCAGHTVLELWGCADSQLHGLFSPAGCM